MLEGISISPELPSEILTFIIWHIIKASLILMAAYTAVLLFHRISSAGKHLLLRTALVMALIIPALTVIVPAWRLVLSGQLASSLPADILLPHSTVSAASGSSGLSGNLLSWVSLAVIVWWAGAALIIMRMALGIVRTRLIINRARIIEESSLLELTRTLSRKMGIKRPVGIRRSSTINTPFTWGLLRPVIILPARSAEWSVEQLRSVLTHEMAHIKRADIFWYTLASIATALYWTTPIVWIVKKHLIIESEKTCDDYVLSDGMDQASYAQHLLSILRSMKDSRAAVPIGVGMARRSHMEGRLMSILSNRKRSTVLSRSLILWTIAISLVLILPIAGIQFHIGEAQAGDQKTDKVKKSDTADEKYPAPDDYVETDVKPELVKMSNPVYPEEAKKKNIQGYVWVKALVDKEGKVVKAMIQKSSGHDMLDKSAVKAAYSNKFKPAMQGDNPVNVWVTYKVNFNLDDDKDTTGKG